MEFAMVIKKSAYQNEESEIEITWSYKDHLKFIDVYNQFNGKMHMDAHLASNFPEIPIAFISILRKKHEMSMATKAIDGIPHDVAPVPVVVAPIETRSLWSNEETTELHYIVQAYLHEVQLDVSKEMWKLIAKMKNGVRTPIACGRKWEKTKSTVGVRVREDAQERLSLYVQKVKDAIAEEAAAAQPEAVEGVEFAMVIREVKYENEKLEMEVTWTLNDHFEFLDVYDKYDGSMPMDVYLSKSVTKVPQSLISCIRRMHEMSMAAKATDVPPVDAPAAPVVAAPFDPKDTRRLWSREEIDELHYLVKAHKSEVPNCLMKDRWKFIANLKNGMRAPEAYKSKWLKTKDSLGAHEDGEQLGLAVERVKKALAEVEAQPEEN